MIAHEKFVEFQKAPSTLSWMHDYASTILHPCCRHVKPTMARLSSQTSQCLVIFGMDTYPLRPPVIQKDCRSETTDSINCSITKRSISLLKVFATNLKDDTNALIPLCTTSSHRFEDPSVTHNSFSLFINPLLTMPILVLDRLQELRAVSGKAGFPVKALEQQVVTSEAPPVMVDFFGSVGEIQQHLTDIKQSIEKIGMCRSQMLQATTSKQEAQVRVDTDAAISHANKLITGTKQEIEAVQKLTDELEANQPGSSDLRMRKNILQTIVRRFKEHLIAFQKAQTDLAEETRGRAVRQLQVAIPTASAEEAEKLVREGATASEAITQKLQVSSQIQEDQTAAHMQVVKSLYALQDKMTDVKRLEQSISALHQMFVEMASLVDKQGEILDHIEVAVTNTKNYTKEAEKSLVTARQKQYNNEKMGMYLCCCCAILLAIILLPMWISGKLG